MAGLAHLFHNSRMNRERTRVACSPCNLQMVEIRHELGRGRKYENLDVRLLITSDSPNVQQNIPLVM